ncbi:MAG: tetratricopeptide repeat protein, partial [Acidobacteria bacterium]|nr:tetratricopeptide repeat protein [Acidobacteriota bacterium]
RRRYPLASYGWLAFLLVLAPTSSVIPIADVFTERRLYLPMMGLLLVVLEFARRIEAPGRAWAAALALVCVPLAYATRERSKVWADRIRFWEDTVSKSPRKWRPRYNLAVVYQEAGQCRKAVQQYEAGAQAQKPDYDYIMMWGLAHRCAGEAGPALARFREAAALEKSAGVYELIASLEAAQGRSAEALASLAQAEAIDRTYWRTYLTRGNVYSSLKNYEAARTAFREVLRVYPSHREAARGLALAEERLRTEAGTRSAR